MDQHRQQHAAPSRNTTERPSGHRIIDRALRAARVGLLPRTEQERIHALCVAAVGGEQNIGVIHRKAESLARKEVEAWLEENRKVQAAITAKVQDASKAETRAEKAKIRARRWREKQKQEDPAFTEKEKHRKQAERAEASRQEELDELLKSGQHPTNIERLRKKDGPLLYVTDEGGKRSPVVTGGYNSAKLEEVENASSNAQGGPDAVARPKCPEGHGPSPEAADSLEPGADSLEPHTLGYRYKYLPPKETRAMRKYIVSHTDERPMMICLVCQEQIAPGFSFEVGFNHLHDKHPQLFEDMIRLVRTAKRCSVDHDGMIVRHGTGDRKLYCRKCRKLLYKPPKTAQFPKAAWNCVRTGVKSTDFLVINSN